MLLLNGARNAIAESLPLDYSAELNTTHWHGVANIPAGYFPKHTTKINAYAIHGPGSDAERIYWSLYPQGPDANAPDL